MLQAIASSSSSCWSAWSAGVALPLFLVVLGCATETRLSSLHIQSLDRSQWQDLKTSCDAVARRFGFDSDAEQYLGGEIHVDDTWTIVGSYSNRGRGSRELIGGRGHVEFSIQARSDSNEAKIIIEDYSGATRTEYMAALEDALAEAVRVVLPSARPDWNVKVVRALRP